MVGGMELAGGGADPPSPPSSRLRGEHNGTFFCNFLSVARFSVTSIMSQNILP